MTPQIERVLPTALRRAMRAASELGMTITHIQSGEYADGSGRWYVMLHGYTDGRPTVTLRSIVELDGRVGEIEDIDA